MTQSTDRAGLAPRHGLSERILRVADVAASVTFYRDAVAVEGPITFESWKADSIYFSDPDGHRVELCGFEHLNAHGQGARA